MKKTKKNYNTKNCNRIAAKARLFQNTKKKKKK